MENYFRRKYIESIYLKLKEIRMKKKAFYIVYNKDDEFLALGTAEEIACHFDLTPFQVRQKPKDFKRHEKTRQTSRFTIRIFGVGMMEVDYDR